MHAVCTHTAMFLTELIVCNIGLYVAAYGLYKKVFVRVNLHANYIYRVVQTGKPLSRIIIKSY